MPTDVFVGRGISPIKLYIYFSLLPVFSLSSYSSLELNLCENVDLALGILKQYQAHRSHLVNICWMNEQTLIFQ